MTSSVPVANLASIANGQYAPVNAPYTPPLGFTVRADLSSATMATAITRTSSIQIVDPAWLYTAVTRAEKQVIIIGDADEFQAALRRPWASDRRRSGFSWTSHNTEKANADA